MNPESTFAPPVDAVPQENLLETIKASVYGQLLVDGLVVHSFDYAEEG